MPLPQCGKIHLVRGYIHGLKTAALRFVITGNSAADAVLAERLATVIDAISQDWPLPANTTISDAPPIAAHIQILKFIADIYAAFRFPIRQKGRAFPIAVEGGARSILLFIPALPTTAEPVAQIIRQMLSDEADAPATAVRALVSKLQTSIPGGPTGLHFMNAALDKSIPFDWLGGNVLQFGQGSKSRWLDGSFTDVTSRSGAALARDKLATSDILRQNGLPVAISRGVHDEASAIEAAARIGYPVVVKPADLDGGVAVQAGLSTPAQVSKATSACLVHSPNVMVEKWVDGRDYRLVVFRDKLIWAIERVPGGVTGDGENSIATLIEQSNRNPMRGTAAHLPLKPLLLDDEAEELLAEQAMQASTVPPAGAFVRMRRAANIARGGLARAAFEEVHPDNRRLAERAARAVNLDLAGIDLLIPDISRSWLETGAAICEVNAQPDLGYSTSAHIYPYLLEAMIHGNGRIPVICVIGETADGPVAHAIEAALRQIGAVVGLADRHGVAVDGTNITNRACKPFSGGLVLMRDRQVNCAIVCINDASVLDSGLPFDACDVIVLAGDAIDGSGRSASEVRYAVLRAILPSCTRLVIAAQGQAINASEIAKMTQAQVLENSVPPQDIPIIIMRLLQNGH